MAEAYAPEGMPSVTAAHPHRTTVVEKTAIDDDARGSSVDMTWPLPAHAGGIE